jgi:aquaporin NIP
MKESILKSLIAEVIGTFLLVFFGCGAIIVNETYGGIVGLQGIAITFGLVVMTVVFAIGHISGAHINPSVTIGLACVGKFSWKKVVPYVIAQMIGGIAGAFILKIFFATGNTLGMTFPSSNLVQSFFIEIILTALLVLVAIILTTDTRAPSQFAAIAIGAVIAIDILVGGPVTGASMNPARSFGPALIMMRLDYVWLYLTAPIIGAIVASLVSMGICRNK